MRENAERTWVWPSVTAVAALVLVTGCVPIGQQGDAESGGEQESRQTVAPTPQSDDAREDENQDDDAEREGASGDDTAEDGSPSFEAGVRIEETVWLDSAEVTVVAEVGPIVRDGDLAVLPMVMERQGSAEVALQDLLDIGAGAVEGDSFEQGSDVRLIDTQRMTTSLPAVFVGDQVDGNMALSASAWLQDDLEDGRSVTVHEVFAAPESEEVHVMLRRLGVAADVPVIEGPLDSVPTTEQIVDGNEELWLDDETWDVGDVQARVETLESYRHDVAERIGRLESEEQSVVQLSSDVLFDIDESELSAEAEDVLQDVEVELDGVDGGDLRIVGHTDDVLDQDYNQSLSEARAEAVRDRLSGLIDFSIFDDVATEGRSFDEPIATNETEAGRAQNRRVELHFTPTGEAPESDEIDRQLPDAPGAQASHPDPVTIELDDGYEIAVDSVTALDGVLVGRVTVRGDGPFYDALNFFYADAGPRGLAHDDVVEQNHWTAYGPTLLSEGQRHYPLDYHLTPLDGGSLEQELADEGVDYIVPLAERDVWPGGDSADAYYTATIVWPDVGDEEVVVDLGFPQDYEPQADGLAYETVWRITDVTVEEME